MSLKIKISILAICFALVAAVCVGFAFAAPSEKLNLKGTLSYEVAKATISVSPNISTLGSTTGSGSETGSGEYVIGETVTLTATPSGSSRFLAWATSTDPETMKIVSASATYSFELTEDSPTTYYALFNSTTTTEQTVGYLKYTFYNEAKLASVTDTTSLTVPSGNFAISSVVPSGENSYKVYSIGSSAFQSCLRLTRITIPEGVTEIGSSAFSNCSSLASITIPSTLTSIGSQAFYYCSSLTSVSLPSTLTSIGSSAFYNCSRLKAFNGEGNEYYRIDDNRALLVDGGKTLLAYAPANTATSYTIPEGVSSIGEGTFQLCSSLTSITLPSTLDSIGEAAFAGCSSLTTISIPEGVTSIGGDAFFGCSNLTSISIPEGVTEIGESAFYNCSSLTTITIPEGVTSIGEGTFQSCSRLTSVSLPSRLTSIGSWAFYGCSSLTSISIPEGVTSIGAGAFQYCYSLTTISIPEGVTSIGYDAFYNCSSLTSITINGNITSLDSNAFLNCYSLKKLTLGAGVTTLPSILFTDNNLIHLTEIVVEEGSTLSAALPPYGRWVKDGGSETVTNFDGPGVYTRTDV